MNDIQPSLSKRAINRKTWQQLLTQWRQSGLTAKQFCQDHRIKEADLKRWSYRLNKRQYSPVANPVPGNDSAAKKFIPVTVSQSTIESARVGSIDEGVQEAKRVRRPSRSHKAVCFVVVGAPAK